MGCLRPLSHFRNIPPTIKCIQNEINNAPIKLIISPLINIIFNETFLIPPKANPFTPVAIGLIKAHVLESVTTSKASKAEKPIKTARDGTIINKLICMAVLLNNSVEKDVRSAKTNNIKNGDKPSGSMFLTNSANGSCKLNKYKITATAIDIPINTKPFIGRFEKQSFTLRSDSPFILSECFIGIRKIEKTKTIENNAVETKTKV